MTVRFNGRTASRLTGLLKPEHRETWCCYN